METALERHAAGQEALAVRETASGLAAASVSANTRRAYEGALRPFRDWTAGGPRSTTPAAPNIWPPVRGGPMLQRLDRAGRPRDRLSTVSVRASSSDVLPMPGSRDACPATPSGSEGRSLSPRPGPRSSGCRPPADGNPPRCPAAIPETSSLLAARLPSSATVRVFPWGRIVSLFQSSGKARETILSRAPKVIGK